MAKETILAIGKLVVDRLFGLNNSNSFHLYVRFIPSIPGINKKTTNSKEETIEFRHGRIGHNRKQSYLMGKQ